MEPERGAGTTRDSDQLSPGDPAMYATLFSRYAPRVKGYLVRRGLSPAAAEEVTQDVMLTVWRKAASYDAHRASVNTWVFAIARNRCTDQLRRQARPEPDPEDPCWVGSAVESAGPEAKAMGDRRDALVREALRTLGADQQEALRQLYFEGQTTAEAAQALGVPVGTVKSRARRALDALRRQLRKGGLDHA